MVSRTSVSESKVGSCNSEKVVIHTQSAAEVEGKAAATTKGRSRHFVDGEQKDDPKTLRQNARDELFADKKAPRTPEKRVVPESDQELEDRIFESTLGQAHVTGTRTNQGSQILARQADTIDQLPKNLDRQLDIVYTAERIHRASSIWGTIVNMFTAPPKPTAVPERKIAPQKTQPDLVKQESGTVDQLFYTVSSIKSEVEGHRGEVGRQNTILDGVNDQTERVQELTERQTRRIRRQLNEV